jgi:hypothetical protein
VSDYVMSSSRSESGRAVPCGRPDGIGNVNLGRERAGAEVRAQHAERRPRASVAALEAGSSVFIETGARGSVHRPTMPALSLESVDGRPGRPARPTKGRR